MPRQDIALFKSIKICSLSLILLSEFKGVGIVYMQIGGQNKSALRVTHGCYEARVFIYRNKILERIEEIFINRAPQHVS